MTPALLYAQKPYSQLTADEKALYDEHIFGGQPDTENLYTRHAYVMNYNTGYRIPDWCAFHIIKEYLKTPPRDKKFKIFRKDTETSNPVEDKEYNKSGYARGHIAPFKIMGGDRNGNGRRASFASSSDKYDEQTVFEGNYLSNITPQFQETFNGGTGLWYKLERWIQDKLVAKNNLELWVYAGSVVTDKNNIDWIGPDDDIAVPDYFYQVVICEGDNSEFPDVLAFLFPHYSKKSQYRLLTITDHVVTVDSLESFTGLDFFNKYSKTVQAKYESKTNMELWQDYFEDR